jgi:hypothetical protein
MIEGLANRDLKCSISFTNHPQGSARRSVTSKDVARSLKLKFMTGQNERKESTQNTTR